MEQKKRTRIFRCKSKKTGEIACGIQYPNGRIRIGVDVWRDLYRMDCASYPVKDYDSIKNAVREYSILPVKKKKLA